MTTTRKRIDIAEFRAAGYLQELNRQFLHPLGMALEVLVDDDGTERLNGIWDYRDDPDGIVYHESVELAEHAVSVGRVVAARQPARVEALGYWVQPAER